MSKFTINKVNIAQIFFLLFLVSLFFSIRYVFPTPEAFKTGAYSDFTSISLYLSDIFLFITCLFILLPRGSGHSPRGGLRRLIVNSQLSIVALLFWLILDLIWHKNTLSSLNWWFFVKYLELMVSYGTSCYLFSKTEVKGLFLRIFVIFSSFESILALWQFIAQKSLGLGKLGEQVLSPTIYGVAKIVSGGTTYIRGYGTFPHPNLLSAFLVVGVLFSIYLFVSTINNKLKTLYAFAILLNCLGLTVTFSRAGFLAAGVGLMVFFVYILLWRHPERVPACQRLSAVMADRHPSEGSLNPRKDSSAAFRMTPLLVVVFSILICFIIFRPYLDTRATIMDDASLQRIFYAKIGVRMIQQNPIFGVGIGESVLHMQQYSPLKLWPWQIQPIHNYFLLAAAELGIPGVLIILWIFLSHLRSLILNLSAGGGSAFGGKSQRENLFALCMLSILISFLVAMQFDHYFYTLQQTQMLLWVILGIIASETNKKIPE